jgi:hypothetical protein
MNPGVKGALVVVEEPRSRRRSRFHWNVNVYLTIWFIDWKKQISVSFNNDFAVFFWEERP